MSCLVGILGWFWSFVKNFFEGHTSHSPRSAFAPPAPLRNEPGCLVYLCNLLCVNLLQYRNTCFYVATSVKISVFGVYFWRSFLCIYYANEFSFLPLLLSYFDSFVLICLLPLIGFCSVLIPLLYRFVYGLNTDSLVNVAR